MVPGGEVRELAVQPRRGCKVGFFFVFAAVFFVHLVLTPVAAMAEAGSRGGIRVNFVCVQLPLFSPAGPRPVIEQLYVIHTSYPGHLLRNSCIVGPHLRAPAGDVLHSGGPDGCWLPLCVACHGQGPGF